MDASLRAALMLVRLIAGCILVIGLLGIGLYVMRCLERAHPAVWTLPIVLNSLRVFPMVLNSIPLLIGIAILIRARTIARWIADKFE
jgi:hypothetical protein